jgi:hypothetical protein
MGRSVVHEVMLARHPESRNGAVRSIGARVCKAPEGRLAITYSIEGDLSRVRVPAPRSPRFVERLWKHTCCECFIVVKGTPEYREFNFAPSCEWAAYAFAKYRKGAPLADEALNPRITVRRDAQRLDLDVSISLDRWSPMPPRATLALALSAVIEEEDAVLSYWALRHPAGKPDFHHPDSFVLEL